MASEARARTARPVTTFPCSHRRTLANTMHLAGGKRACRACRECGSEASADHKRQNRTGSAGIVKPFSRMSGTAIKQWTAKDVAHAKRRWSEGASAMEIAKELGTTRNAVCGKLDRLGRVAQNKVDKNEVNRLRRIARGDSDESAILTERQDPSRPRRFSWEVET